jgi:glycosyltransferase involved in cell wall biosynthesis
MTDITIVTCTYNRPNLLPRTVESVLSQTFSDFEYIIINNGSSDNDTPKLLKQYSALDKRIDIITRSHNDVSTKNFTDLHTMLKNRQSIFFMQVDDDDYIEPDTVELLYKLITENDADIATVGSMWVYPDGSSKNKFIFDGTFIYSRIDAMTELLKREKFNSAQGGKLYRKSLFENITPPYFDCFRDIYREYRVINNVHKMVVTGKPKFYFYRHDNNISGLDTEEQITPTRMRQHLEANAMRTEWLSEHMPEIRDFVFYSELSFMISLYERINRLKVESCYNIAQEMKYILLRHKTFLSECGFCTDKEKEILKLI